MPVMSSVASALEPRVGVGLYPSGDSSALKRFANDGTAPVIFSVTSSASINAPIVGTSPVTSSIFCEALNVNVPVRSAEFGVATRPMLARRLPGVCFPSLFNWALFDASPSLSMTGDKEKDTPSPRSSGDGVPSPAAATFVVKVSCAALNSNVSVRSPCTMGITSTLVSSTSPNPAGTPSLCAPLWYDSPLFSRSSSSLINSRTLSNCAGSANDTRRPIDCRCFFRFVNAGDAGALSP